MHLAHEELEEVAPLVAAQDVVEVTAKEGADYGGEILVPGGEDGVHDGQVTIALGGDHPPQDLVIEAVLAVEVVVHRGHVDLGRGGDVADGDGVESALGEEGLGCVQEPVARVARVFVHARLPAAADASDRRDV